MSELETLARNLFERTDGKTLDFKVFLGTNRDVLTDDVCAEVNKVFAQERNGLLKAIASLDRHMERMSAEKFLAQF